MTDMSVRQFLEYREEEIKELRASLLRELREIQVARSALEQIEPEATNDENTRPTIKEMIVRVLFPNQGGGNPEEIIGWIKEHYRIEIQRSSLSPQLSRLKAEGRILLSEESSIWNLSSAERMRLQLEDRRRNFAIEHRRR